MIFGIVEICALPQGGEGQGSKIHQWAASSIQRPY